MPRARTSAIVLLLASLVAGCGGAGRDAGVPLEPPEFDVGQGSVEWRASLPCTDCRAIETRLVLERDGPERRYELVEVFVALDGSVSFEESGNWRLEDALLSLEPETGGLRNYGLVRGGALQVLDLRGRPFPGREGELLLPSGRGP